MNNQNLHAAVSTLFLFILLSLFSVKGYTQTKGCTDPLATNYNASAFMNDGSCVYSPASVNAVSSTQLPTQMKGTSGLIWMNNKLWTQNNFSDINLYTFDPAQVNSFQTLPLTGTVNIDWEEMTQDEEYLYIGDFGNNVNGNRTNLQILRIKKTTLFQSSPQIDTIKFSYSTQSNFTPTGANKTNYDCEAFVVTKDGLYLFTKEWLTNKTSIYRVSKISGTHTAQYVSTLDVQGLITGAMLMEDKRLLVLCGYNSTLQPFLYLLYDYTGTDFFGGNKRRININLPFHQVEAITTQDGINYHITNEYISRSGITIPQQLHQLNLNAYLSRYLSTTNIYDYTSEKNFSMYPVPAKTFIQMEVNTKRAQIPYRIIDSRGIVVQQGIWSRTNNRLNIDLLPPGSYWMIVTAEKTYVKQWVKE